MSDFSNFIGMQAIYIEKGFVALVRLTTVTGLLESDEVCVDFNLEIISLIKSRGLGFQVGDCLEVGSAYLTEENEVITASGYVAWSLIFNEIIKSKILRYNEEGNPRVYWFAKEKLMENNI